LHDVHFVRGSVPGDGHSAEAFARRRLISGPGINRSSAPLPSCREPSFSSRHIRAKKSSSNAKKCNRLSLSKSLSTSFLPIAQPPTMSSLSNGTCSNNAVPDNLPEIPKNVTAVVIPGTNASDPWMVNCCKPYPDHIVEKCWEWCEIDPGIVKNTTGGLILDKFSSCLDMEHRNLNTSNGVMLRPASGGSRPSLSFAGLVLVVSVLVANFSGL
jgi:hypothetical protein